MLGAPELHRWHHARVGRTRHNFANVAPWLDVLFGTHHLPEGDEACPLGIPERWPRGYLAQLVRPFLRRPRGGRWDRRLRDVPARRVRGSIRGRTRTTA